MSDYPKMTFKQIKNVREALALIDPMAASMTDEEIVAYRDSMQDAINDTGWARMPSHLRAQCNDEEIVAHRDSMQDAINDMGWVPSHLLSGSANANETTARAQCKVREDK